MLSKAELIALEIVGGSNPFAYRSTWLHTIYVSPTGNNTTGNGKKATPYQTLTKALEVAVAGDGILLANGTYAETTGANGYLTVSKNLADWLVIEPELGRSGSVTIKGTGTSSINVYFVGTASSHLHFRDLTFTNATGTSTTIRMNTASNNIKFTRCNYVNAAGAAYGFYSTALSDDITFDSCVFTGVGTAMDLSFISNAMTGWTITNCTIGDSTTLKGVATSGTIGAGMSFTNCTITGKYPIFIDTGGSPVFTNCVLNVGDGGSAYVGKDAIESTPNVASASVINCTVNKATNQVGHALLFGAGVVGGLIDGVTIPQAYDYAVVIKENSGVEIRNCNLTGGTQAAIYYKGTTAPDAHNNTLTCSQGYGFRLGAGDGGRKTASWLFDNNTINVSGTGKALDIGTSAAADAGGGVSDYNTYQNNSGLGKVRADTNVADLTELQAAWADYDVTTNDSHSSVV